MSKAPRHQGPQLRLCCGLLTSCPTQKAAREACERHWSAAPQDAVAPTFASGEGLTDHASRQTVTNDPRHRRAGSHRLVLTAGSGAGARWDLGLTAVALYGLKAPHKEGSDR